MCDFFQRFQCNIVGIVFLLIIKNTEAEVLATCTTVTSTWTWSGQEQSFKTCRPEISEIDDEAFTISSLTDRSTLGLSVPDKKGVKYLPKNLFRVFPDLNAFSFWNCSVTSVSEYHFINLFKLKTLTLANNKIEHISSDAFADLVNLEHLSLNNNRIQGFGKNIFFSLKAIKRLYLQNNEIQSLHPKIFSELLNVELIHLNYNEISNLDENIFENMDNLKNISLEHNKIERIPRNLFKNNLKLEQFWFYDNRAKFIDADTFNHLSRLQNVDLRANICTKVDYYAINFKAMKSDLEQNCSENANQHILERTLAEIQRKMETMARENSEMSQKLKLLEINLVANYEALSKRVDALNEASPGVAVVFDG